MTNTIKRRVERLEAVHGDPVAEPRLIVICGASNEPQPPVIGYRQGDVDWLPGEGETLAQLRQRILQANGNQHCIVGQILKDDAP